MADIMLQAPRKMFVPQESLGRGNRRNAMASALIWLVNSFGAKPLTRALTELPTLPLMRTALTLERSPLSGLLDSFLEPFGRLDGCSLLSTLAAASKARHVKALIWL